ncbi:hypothetical protein [Mannheimia indoligenes]|uniref:hypothetical protein n=1 Tax=Mannheimia indoligenes TaxID=3103145 RepID=UPI002FE5DA9D
MAFDEYDRVISDKAPAFNRHWEYSYNEENKVASRTSYDSRGQVIEVRKYDEYVDDFAQTAKVYNDKDAKELVSTEKFILGTNGAILNTLIDSASNGVGWDTYNFGDSNRIGTNNLHRDFTAWSEQQLAELGTSLSLIRMAHGSSSQLTLNAEVVAAISNGGLKVEGARDDFKDTLNLSGFQKASNSDVVNYDLYKATIGDESLNVYVQNNIDVNILG